MAIPLNDESPSFFARCLRRSARTGSIPLDILSRIASLLERLQPPDWSALERTFTKEFTVARLGSDLLSKPRTASTWNSGAVTQRRVQAFLKGSGVSPTLTSDFLAWLVADAAELDRATQRISDALNKGDL